MRPENSNRWEYGNGSKDAARISTLMGNTGGSGDPSTRPSIPMPSMEGERKWDARGAMTLEGYQRLRRGYERGINPEALERMEEQGEGTRQFPQPAPPYDVPLRTQNDADYDVADTDEQYNGSGAMAQSSYEGPRAVYGEDPQTTGERSVERPRPVEQARPRRMGPIAVTLVLLVGIVGALLLYAGGIEYLTDFFRGEKPSVDENLTLVTERPGAAPAVDPAGTPAPGEAMEMDVIAAAAGADPEVPEEGAIPEDDDAVVQGAMEAEKARREELLLAEKKKAEEARLAKEKADAELKAKEARAKKEAEKAKAKQTAAPAPTVKPVTAAAAKPAPAKPQAASAKSFTVQVRATPNKEEADRVARSLRAKGGADVHIIAAEKDGETVYRVRFGSFGSAEEGKAKAGEMGFANVWVIKR